MYTSAIFSNYKLFQYLNAIINVAPKYFNWIFIVEFFSKSSKQRKNIHWRTKTKEWGIRMANIWCGLSSWSFEGRTDDGSQWHTLDQPPWKDHFFLGEWRILFWQCSLAKMPYFIRLISLHRMRLERGSKSAHQAMLLGIIKAPNSWCFCVSCPSHSRLHTFL